MRKRAAVLIFAAVAALAGCSSAPSQGSLPVIKLPESTAPSVPRVAPAGIDIPKINAHSTLIPLGLNPDQSLAAPDVKHPQQASYYCIVDPNPQTICSSGVLPGQVGPAVIIGHVDGAKQQGIFYNLKKLQEGDTFTVTLKDGTVLTFRVYKVREDAKTSFPTQVIYAPTSLPEVRLITCTGKWVGGSLGYANNFIAMASLVPTPPN